MSTLTFDQVFKDFDPISPCPSTVAIAVAAAPPLVHTDSSDSVTTVIPTTPSIEDTVLFTNPFPDAPAFAYHEDKDQSSSSSDNE